MSFVGFGGFKKTIYKTVFDKEFLSHKKPWSGSGSRSDPDSATAWIRITIQQQPVSRFGFRNILYPDPDSTKGLDLDQDPKRYL
jgi:hypothetical protein